LRAVLRSLISKHDQRGARQQQGRDAGVDQNRLSKQRPDRMEGNADNKGKKNKGLLKTGRDVREIGGRA
jgi:hypothetical protein